MSRWRLDGSGLITDVVARGHVAYEGYDTTGQTLLVASRPPNATIWSDFDEFTVWNSTTTIAIWPSAGGTRLYAGFPDGQIWTLDAATRQRIGPTLRAAGSPRAISATAASDRPLWTAATPRSNEWAARSTASRSLRAGTPARYG